MCWADGLHSNGHTPDLGYCGPVTDAGEPSVRMRLEHPLQPGGGIPACPDGASAGNQVITLSYICTQL